MSSIQITFEVPFEESSVYDQEDRNRIEGAILEAVTKHLKPEPLRAQAIWVKEDAELGIAESHFDWDAYQEARGTRPMVELNHMMMNVLKVRVLWEDEEHEYVMAKEDSPELDSALNKEVVDRIMAGHRNGLTPEQIAETLGDLMSVEGMTVEEIQEIINVFEPPSDED